MAAQYISGQGGSVGVGSGTLCVESWTVNFNCESLDVTDTCGLGFASNIPGIRQADGTIKTWYDASTSPFGPPLNIIEGSTGTFTFHIGNSAHSIVMPVRITKISLENPVRGVVTYNLDFVSNGQYSSPS